MSTDQTGSDGSDNHDAPTGPEQREPAVQGENPHPSGTPRKKKYRAKVTRVGSLPPDAAVYSGGSTLYSPRRFSSSGPSTPTDTGDANPGPISPAGSPQPPKYTSAGSSIPTPKYDSKRPYPWERPGGPPPERVWLELLSSNDPDMVALRDAAAKVMDVGLLASLLTWPAGTRTTSRSVGHCSMLRRKRTP